MIKENVRFDISLSLSIVYYNSQIGVSYIAYLFTLKEETYKQ